MNCKTSDNKYQFLNSALLVYTLLFTLIIPTQILAEPFPANSVFSQNSIETMQINNPEIDKSFGNVPVHFEQNRGQFNSKVKYFARGTNQYSLFLTGTEAVYVLRESSESRVQSSELEDEKRTLNSEPGTLNSKATAVYMKLVGANDNSSSVGLEELEHKTNYFRGNDKSKWQTNVPNFRQIQMNDVYSGIDAIWKGKENGGVQYDFVVAPNANPNQIEWEIDGAESVEIDSKGDLLIKTEFGEIRQQKPFTFQEETNGLKQEVESGFKIEQSTIRNSQSTIVKFNVGNYDPTKTLTIDPNVNLSRLSASTFLGGDALDQGNAIAVDRAGNVYVTGQTSSILFPTTPGTFDPTSNNLTDGFISKINASGTDLIYSTYIGGSITDVGYGIKVDASGNAYVAGRSDSSNFPSTAGVFQPIKSSSGDAFALKLNSTGSALIYSTFIGGTGFDQALAMDIDASGNSYIHGNTSSSNFPTTAGAFDTTFNGGSSDVFVAKLNPTATALVYSTYLGGSGTENADGIAVDESGNAYITGDTDDDTTDFPSTAGSFQPTHNGGTDDVFVTKLNPTASALVYSSFLGGTGDEIGGGIAIDPAGNAYVTGTTFSTDFPTLTAFDTTFNGSSDVFVTKFNPTGSAINYSTYIGGSSLDEGKAISVDRFGSAYVTGRTFDATTDYPTTAGAYDETHNGSIDVFVTKLSVPGSTLITSTFIGSSTIDEAEAIAVDANGNAYITGEGRGSDYPTTTDAYQSTVNGTSNMIISKLGDFSISGKTLDTSGNPLPNTAVAMSGGVSDFMLSDPNGYFGFTDTRQSGTHLISALQTLYNFNPPNYEVFANINQEINFIGRPTSSGPTAALAPLGGTVESTVGNVGLPNTRLTLIDTVNGNVSVVTTDSNGDYEFNAVVTGAFYLVIAERNGYNFSPQIYEVNHFDENENLDFLASPNSPRPVDDFDGDGKTDLAVFRPNEGNWYILNSQDNSVRTVNFGLNGDIPVASDYDGDNRADIAVYRPTEGNWYWLDSADGDFHSVHFGTNGDLPVQADFDGDSKTDIAVYRPSSGVWHRLNSTDGQYSSIKFGIETDVPVAADYDADGKADIGVFRDGIWYRMRSSDNQVEAFQFGLENDKPQVGDFDGDGRLDTAVYRPSNGAWYWLKSSDGDFQARQFGISTDIPTPADYNGDGRFEQSVFRNGTWYVLRNDNSFYASQFGQTDDVPIP